MKGRAILIFVIAAIPIVIAIALLAMGGRLQQDVLREQPIHVSTHTLLKTCTVTNVQVSSCVSGGWAAVWKCAEGELTIVETPFSLKRTREEAERNMNDYSLNQTVNVICNAQETSPYPSVDCKLSRTCMFDIPTVLFLQRLWNIYAYSGVTLFANGAILLIVGVCLCVVIALLFRSRPNQSSYVRAQDIQ